MNIVTWNLNHRITQKVIPENLVPTLMGLKPDIIVLTEFFDGPTRAPFHKTLSDFGFDTLISDNEGRRHNQILIGSRVGKIRPGSIRGRKITEAFPSNVLHAQIGSLDVLGVRIPDYSKTPKDRVKSWDWILQQSDLLKIKNSVIIGDLNTDPSYPKARCGDRLQMLCDQGWTSCLPKTGHSYLTLKGQPKRIDHGFLSMGLKLIESKYVEQDSGVRFIGPGKALSDHAPLLINFQNI